MPTARAAFVLLGAWAPCACVVTTHESYDARYGSLMPAPLGPAIAGPSAIPGSQDVGLGLFSGFGGQTQGTVVGGASGNISANAGGRFVAKSAVLDNLEVGAAFSIRPGFFGTAAASDTRSADFKTDVALSATFASRWWIARGSFSALGLITELSGDLVPHRSRTVVEEVKTVGTIFGPVTSDKTVDLEHHFGLTFYPKLRAGPIVQFELGRFVVLTGGASIGNEVVVDGMQQAERTCDSFLITNCDAPRTPEGPDSRQTLAVVPFFAPSVRLDDRLSILVQVHAVLAEQDVARPAPFGVEAGLILTL